ncbi:MAG TPA: hemolysin III family protein [Solirubrobacteraceae bacterium]|nr:hemolysin III family protein [Solirubrobacteraceae bacterium]
MPDELVPVLRGVMHAWAFWFALVAGLVLLVLAPAADARIAALVYAIGLCALFAGSGLYHRWRWDPRWRPLLRRIDHSTIFVFIAASYTPIALLVLDGPLRVVVLIGVWAGAVAGVAFSVAWIGAPRALTAGTYLALGWFAVITIPQLVDRLPLVPLTLLAAGGVLYTVGALVYAAKRPNPWPRTFGFHEVFHTFVILAAAAHFAAMAGWVIPGAS